ncbi:MAG: hypothetical protein AW07_01243 [Candidatus Accumulibacter sp. SK-11]|nr:MAG: hypothetical protein AW07_01243 [Candidatus Accumulibacter sp. SK-11]
MSASISMRFLTCSCAPWRVGSGIRVRAMDEVESAAQVLAVLSQPQAWLALASQRGPWTRATSVPADLQTS